MRQLWSILAMEQVVTLMWWLTVAATCPSTSTKALWAISRTVCDNMTMVERDKAFQSIDARYWTHVRSLLIQIRKDMTPPQECGTMSPSAKPLNNATRANVTSRKDWPTLRASGRSSWMSMDLNQEHKVWEGSKHQLTPNTENKKAYCSWAHSSSKKVALSVVIFRSKATTTKGHSSNKPRCIETLSWTRWLKMTSWTVQLWEEFQCRMSRMRLLRHLKSVLTVALYAWQALAKTRVLKNSSRFNSATCIVWCLRQRLKLCPKSQSLSLSREYPISSKMNSSGWLKKNWFNRKIIFQVWLSHCRSSRTLWSNQQPSNESVLLKAPTGTTLAHLNLLPLPAWAALKVWAESAKGTSRASSSRSPTTKTRSSSCRRSPLSSTR